MFDFLKRTSKKRTERLFAMVLAMLVAAGPPAGTVSAAIPEDGYGPGAGSWEAVAVDAEEISEEADSYLYMGEASEEADSYSDTGEISEEADSYPDMEEASGEVDPYLDPGECLITLNAGEAGFFPDEEGLRCAGISMTGPAGSEFAVFAETLPVPQTEEALFFGGWSLEPGGPALTAEDGYFLSGSVTLYAVWTAEPADPVDTAGFEESAKPQDPADSEEGKAVEDGGIKEDDGDDGITEETGAAEDAGMKEEAGNAEGAGTNEDSETDIGDPADLEENLHDGTESEDAEESEPKNASESRHGRWNRSGCTVTFDANGGYFHRGSRKTTIRKKTFEEGEKIKLADFEPHTDGKEEFRGWSLERDGEPIPGDTIQASDGMILYAVWSRIRDISDAEITLSKDIVTYNGNAQKPAVTVVYEGKILTKGTDYKVDYKNNKNAGTATVTVTGKGTYTGTAKKQFRIDRAAQKLTLTAPASKVLVGKTVTAKVTGQKEEPKTTWTSSDKGVATVSSKGKVTAKKVGKAVIKASVAATDNYKAACISVTIKVVPGTSSKLTASNEKKGIRLTWKKVTGADGYVIYRNGKKVKTIIKGGIVTWLDQNANIQRKKYTYMVAAKGSTGTSTLANTVSLVRAPSGRAVSTKTKQIEKPGSATSTKTTTSESAVQKNPAASGGADRKEKNGGSKESGGSDQPTIPEDPEDRDRQEETGGQEVTTAPSGVRYCLEEDYVAETLNSCGSGDLAVIDTDGVSRNVIAGAINRGVEVYSYLNAGALEQERSYYSQFKGIRIAKYDGWEGEYWVDVTSKEWKAHLIQEAKNIRSLGVTGIYFDNTDILYMVETGFNEEKTAQIAKYPSAGEVYKALRDTVISIQNEAGLIVMPNGGDIFVRRFVNECPGVLQVVNQEGVLYEGNKRQSSSDTEYYTDYLDWCRDRGICVRGIEYINTEAGAQKAKDYYAAHKWQSVYISRHEDLRGD